MDDASDRILKEEDSKLDLHLRFSVKFYPFLNFPDFHRMLFEGNWTTSGIYVYTLALFEKKNLQERKRKESQTNFNFYLAGVAISRMKSRRIREPRALYLRLPSDSRAISSNPKIEQSC